MSDRAASSAFDAWVDAFRWTAAASVLITHVDIRMLTPVRTAAETTWPRLMYAFVAGFDHQAVMVFFVLSGYLVGGAAVREHWRTGTIDYAAYLGRRAIRLGIVVWPGLALSALCMALAVRLGAVQTGVLPLDVAETFGPPVLLCNMAYLQTALCPQYAANGALWSLFNEAWYYVLFPPLYLGLIGGDRRGVRRLKFAGAASVLCLLSALQFTGAALLPYFGVWLTGVAVAVCRRSLVTPFTALLLLLAVLLSIRLLVRRSFAPDHPLLAIVLDLVFAVTFGTLLLACKCDANLPAPPWPGLHRTLADFSFSLYCTHIPILTLTIICLQAATGAGWQMRADAAGSWLAIAVAITIAVAFAWLFSRVTERHTSRLRAWLLTPQHSKAQQL